MPPPPEVDPVAALARVLSSRFGCEVSPQRPGHGSTSGIGVWRLRSDELTRAAAEVGSTARGAPSTIVAWQPGSEPEPVDRLRTTLEREGARVLFTGCMGPEGSIGDEVVAILAPDDAPPIEPAPPEFSVVAVMACFNEADILRGTVEHLLAQNIEVHLIDNWSTDESIDTVADLVGNGVRAVERFPLDGRSDEFDLAGLLTRVEQIATAGGADWFVHHDVDERRDCPWPQLTLRDGLHIADSWGFNAVDHTLLEFRPTDEGFRPGDDPAAHLRHFELTPASAITTAHIKAWKFREQGVDLAGKGGHDVRFDGRRVFPYRFLLRHYPIRSQSHGERKVLRERLPRYPSSDVLRGWHFHYSNVQRGHSFLRDPADLETYDETFPERFLLPRIAGVGIRAAEPTSLPAHRRAALRLLRATGLLRPLVNARRKWLLRRWRR